MEFEKVKEVVQHFLENENVVDLNLCDKISFRYFEEIKGTAKDNSSNLYKSYNYDICQQFEQEKGLLGIDVRSKFEAFCYFCNNYYNETFLGERKKETRETDTVLGEYAFKTYGEIKNEVEIFASALYQFENIEPITYTDNGAYNQLKMLGIWSKNRIEWFTTDYACAAINYVTVPIFDTLGITSVKYIFEKCQMKICCIEAEKLERLIKMKEELNHLEILIIYDEWSLKSDIKQKANKAGYKVYFYKDLIDTYKNKNIIPNWLSFNSLTNKKNDTNNNDEETTDNISRSSSTADKCQNGSTNGKSNGNLDEDKNNNEYNNGDDDTNEKNDINTNKKINENGNNVNNTKELMEQLKKNRTKVTDVCTVIFTSGTSGKPKGAMITHFNFLTFLQSYILDGNRLGIKKYDITFSYLPLAHIYERVIEFSLMFFGGKIGYFSGNIKDLVNDISELKPTFLITVPRILQKIYDNIMEGLKNKSFIARCLVKSSIKWKKNIYMKTPTKFKHPVYDLILQPIRNKFGGCLRTQVMGSAAMDKNKLIELQMIFSTPIVEGWGMTEVGVGFLQHQYDNIKGTIGGLFCNVIMKVINVQNMKYDPKAYPNRGELCVKSTGSMVGYFRDEELTKKSFDEDGFFLTGDVVEINENNKYVRIIDRAKNIFKLSQGEYIEPEKLENLYTNSFYIENIFVHGYSYENELVAIIVPNEYFINDYAKKHDINVSYQDLLQMDIIKKLIYDEILNISKKYNLNGIEKIHLFHLTDIPFSIENKQLTPTHKIVRNIILETYKDIIDDLYLHRKRYK
uniref:long-chain-fatty-acid--CoA ligase n=1 Tax=Piliocolobus tephrosceles TaxID=591936 RepID=A0A8C9LKM7_9PRIM